MAGGKETTRQKMINIMYLVLTAMLALNVSDSILNAFKTIKDSLEVSGTNVRNGIDATFNAFEQTKLKDEPARAKPFYDKAVLARQYVGELDAYIDGLKKTFTQAGGEIVKETGDMSNRSDLDIAPRLMINDGKGKALKAKINETREKLLALFNDPIFKGPDGKIDKPTIALSADDPKGKSWEESNFGDGTPLTAAMTILAKIQTDGRNAEAEAVKKIFSKMEIPPVRLDQFAAVAVAPSSYIIRGQQYNAEVFLTAYDSKSSPDITVNGTRLQTKDGKGTYSINTSKEGEYSWVGTVRVKQTDGTVKEYKTSEVKYRVAPPSATVSPTGMNVFYAGISNPVEVSAPGIAKESLKVSMPGGGSISGGNGKYAVSVPAGLIGKEVNVNVAGDVGGGKISQLGAYKFRVKRVPPPIAKFAGKGSGGVNANTAKQSNEVVAVLENFEFDVKYKVTKFTFFLKVPRRSDPFLIQGNGSTLSAEMRTALQQATPGSQLVISDISASGPSGTVVLENGIALKLQ